MKYVSRNASIDVIDEPIQSIQAGIWVVAHPRYIAMGIALRTKEKKAILKLALP